MSGGGYPCRPYYDHRTGKYHYCSPPIIPISIPNFNYPPNIYRYLMSQSGGYNITFTTPSNTTYDIATAGDIIIPSDDTSDDTSGETTAPTPLTTTAAPTTIPAYSTTLAPTPTPSGSSPTTIPPTSSPSPMSLDAKIPLIWVAAIRSMEFVQYDLRPPLTTIDQMRLLYSTLASEIQNYLDKETDPQIQKGNGNCAAAIYFCTVITVAFSYFPPALLNAKNPTLNTYFLYNNLHGVNSPFSQIFANSDNYNTIVTLNYYCIQLSYVFKPYITKPNEIYIPITDNVMKYMMNPTIFTNILQILNLSTPIPDYL